VCAASVIRDLDGTRETAPAMRERVVVVRVFTEHRQQANGWPSLAVEAAKICADALGLVG
jgi:hypothetical protein